MARATDTRFDEASWLRIAPARGETLRTALERELREAIRTGALRASVRLPSSRALATQLGVSRGVVSDVYAQLEAQGFLAMRPRRAPEVAAVPRAIECDAEPSPAPAMSRVRFDLTPTTPDVSLFPTRAWVHALTQAARRAPADALDYGDPRGAEALREALADHLGRTRGVVADPERIVVVQGTAQGVDLLLRLLRERGARRIAVEDPSLRRQQERIRALGLAIAGQPVDGHGMVVDRLGDADAVIATPAHHFPTGAVLSGERRRALLDWAREHDGLVIEDDYDAEFRYDREPVRALQGLDPERVAYLGTTSKTLAPALRLAWLVAPPSLADDAARIKRLLDVCSPALDQLALAELLTGGAHDRHVRRVRAIYRARRDRLAEALAEHLPQHPVEGIAAGLHALLRLPPGTDDAAIAAAAERAGIRVEPLSDSTIAATRSSGLVIGYGRIHESAIEPAIAALAELLAS